MSENTPADAEPKPTGAMLEPETGMFWLLFMDDPQENAPDALGLIPSFIDPRDKRPVAEQIDEAYQHGGGWKPVEGMDTSTIDRLATSDGTSYALLATVEVHGNELVCIYECGWTTIRQTDGTVEVARLD